jgi:hypothetical protein
LALYFQWAAIKSLKVALRIGAIMAGDSRTPPFPEAFWVNLPGPL